MGRRRNSDLPIPKLKLVYQKRIYLRSVYPQWVDAGVLEEYSPQLICYLISQPIFEIVLTK